MTDPDKNMTAEELASAFWEHFSKNADHNQASTALVDSLPDTAPIERSRREEAVRAAIANVGLEGLVPPQAFKDLAERYIVGEVELDALREYVVLRMAAKTP